MSGKTTLKKLAVAVVLTLGCAELGACVGARRMRDRGLFYDPAIKETLAGYLAQRDPVLGWRPKLPHDDIDASGARRSPSFPDPSAKACVTVYGDSFAWGDEADADHGWAEVVSKRAGCRVSNFGANGYGTDQAYLRYLGNTRDDAKTAVLLILSENIIRNVNRLRNLVSPTDQVGLKPRFVLDARGGLALVPMMVPSSDDDLRDVVAHPERRLSDEFFAPGGPAGTTRFTFPYTLSVVRVMSSYKLKAAMKGEPSHAPFYRPDHPSRGLDVTAGIAAAFHDEAKKRGAKAFVLLVPLVPDFAAKKKTGAWPAAPLFDRLKSAKINVIDAAADLEEKIAGRDPCSLYHACAGRHFNDEGYRLLGEVVHARLRDAGAITMEDKR